MSAKSSVKAVDYPSPDTLLQLDPHIVDALDFTGFFPEKYGFEKLDRIFPKDPKYGKEDPPPHYLTAGRKIREWRKISRGTASSGAARTRSKKYSSSCLSSEGGSTMAAKAARGGDSKGGRTVFV